MIAVGAVLRLVLEGWTQWLTAAVDTSARAGHDFHKIIVAFAAFHRLNEASGFSEAAECCTVQLHALNIDLQFLEGTDLAKNLQRTLFTDLRIFTGYGVVSGTKRCFQNSAAGTEDNTGSGCFTERIVKIALRKSGYIDMIGLDETAYLTGGQNIINIMSGSGAVHARESQLALLGHTRHDGNTGDIFRCNAFFL